MQACGDMNKSIDRIAAQILDPILQAEQPVTDSPGVILGRLTDWFFLFLSAIIGAIVAVKIYRMFAHKKRLHHPKLFWAVVKEAFSVTVSTLMIAVVGFALIVIGLGAIRGGAQRSPFLTVAALILVPAYFIQRRREKRFAKAKPLLEHHRQKKKEAARKRH